MAGELLTSLSIFKALYDSAKALKDMNDATVRNAAVIELQEKIRTAQEAQTALTERIRELEKQVADFETWDTDKKDYEMKALASGSIVYALKPEVQGSKPSHYICATCYEHRKKSPLQRKAGSIVNTHLGKPPMYVCPECKSEIIA